MWRMKEIKLRSGTLESDLEDLLRQVFESEISSGDCRLIVESTRKGKDSGKSVSIEPTSHDCAQIIAFAENDGEIVYLTIGQNTVLEMPIHGGRYTNFEGAEELTRLVQAVGAGRFEETLWLKDSEIVKSVGTIFIGEGKRIEIRTSRLRNPFVRLSEKVVKYSPYVA